MGQIASFSRQRLTDGETIELSEDRVHLFIPACQISALTLAWIEACFAVGPEGSWMRVGRRNCVESLRE